MTQYRTAVPRGVQDTLPAEMYHQRLSEERIRRLFYHAGYDELQTPSFEYFDVFAHGIGSVGQERMIKFFDDDGRILALRPDLTLPIARLAATRSGVKFPLRACYFGNAYDMQGAYGRQREFAQAGIELLGERGPAADAEVILLAAKALEVCGLDDYQIEIGQVEFFKGLLEQWGLREYSEQLRAMVDEKNMLDIELFFKDKDSAARDAVLELTALYGGAEALEGARRLSSHPRCERAIENLRAVHSMLSDFGIGERLCFDFGMLHSLDYYSGVIFRGMTKSLNMPLLSGGRYDNLLGEFGKDAEATGFAMGIKRVLTALEREKGLSGVPQVSAMVSCEKGALSKAYALTQRLRDEGGRVVTAFNLTREELTNAAKERGCEAIFVEGGE